jgi:DNA-binding transcriptional LysR family regulator
MHTVVSMRAFAKVFETKSFADAARRMKLSPAMVTKHIQNLESRIGARLLNRTIRGVSLTESSAAYYERCVALLADLADAEASAASLGQLPHGRLRISASVDFGVVEVWPIVSSFMGKYPDIAVDLVLRDEVVDVVAEEHDLAVRLAEQMRDSSLIVRRLVRSNLLLCTSPAYLRRVGRPASPRDLLSHRCLVYTLTNAHEGWVLRRQGASERIKMLRLMGTNLLSLSRAAAVDGAGIIMHPTFSVCDDLAAGQLTTVLDDWDAGALNIFVAFPSRKLVPTKTRLFIDFLAAHYPTGPDHDIRWQRILAAHGHRKMGKT